MPAEYRIPRGNANRFPGCARNLVDGRLRRLGTGRAWRPRRAVTAREGGGENEGQMQGRDWSPSGPVHGWRMTERMLGPVGHTMLRAFASHAPDGCGTGAKRRWPATKVQICWQSHPCLASPSTSRSHRHPADQWADRAGSALKRNVMLPGAEEFDTNYTDSHGLFSALGTSKFVAIRENPCQNLFAVAVASCRSPFAGRLAQYH